MSPSEPADGSGVDQSPTATRQRSRPTVLWVSAALIVGAATLALLALQRLRSSISVAVPGYVSWQGDYSKIGSFLLWTLGDTTEPGYAHSALAGP